MTDYTEFHEGELVPGTRYRVLRLIGVGGMGSVYEVEHVELGKHFVLKVLLRELARRADLVLRLRNEWRALGRLEHPNIVAVTDAGTSASGQPFYVMERLEGEILSQRMRRVGRFAVADAIEISAGVLDGLSAAHQIGVVHRDVKPANVFVLSDGRPKVLDFGVAKIADDPRVVTARGIAVGTPRYMSPEQARGESVDGRADVYATGLMLFEMLTGSGPFEDARDANDLILAHIARTPPVLSTIVPGIPKALDELVASMLHKDRNARPATALEAARALREISASRPLDAGAAPVPGTLRMRSHTLPLAEYNAEAARRDRLSPLEPARRADADWLGYSDTELAPTPTFSEERAPSSRPLRSSERSRREPTEALTLLSGDASEPPETRTAAPREVRRSETPPPVDSSAPEPLVSQPRWRRYSIAALALATVVAIVFVRAASRRGNPSADSAEPRAAERAENPVARPFAQVEGSPGTNSRAPGPQASGTVDAPSIVPAAGEEPTAAPALPEPPLAPPPSASGARRPPNGALSAGSSRRTVVPRRANHSGEGAAIVSGDSAGGAVSKPAPSSEIPGDGLPSSGL